MEKKIAILGDIHANIDALNAVLEDATAENVTDFLCVGDVVGYNATPNECMEIIKKLRLGETDIIVGINLLREGLDLPEVKLVAILDADKEGFLRNKTSLLQTIGRAARNVNGRAILYADNITKSIQDAINETNRHREIQLRYNKENNRRDKRCVCYYSTFLV